VAWLTPDTIPPDLCTKKVARPAGGAVLTFAGTVRDSNADRRVEALEYFAYDSMALRELERIEREVEERWPGVRAAIAHRVGLLKVGETSVFIAVGSAHRAEGFEALRHAIEELKKKVPIWKKEIYTDGHAWIEGS
jgi:molybdopterin synthase catalytic subunit